MTEEPAMLESTEADGQATGQRTGTQHPVLGRLVESVIHHRFLVIFGVLLVGALGVRAMQELPIDAVPDVTNVQVQVLTNVPSLGPLEVEQYVTFPIENTMSGLPKLEEVRSVSRFGLSAVTLVFEEDTDIYFARQLVQERLSSAREAIPDGYGTPEIGPISSGLGEIYQFEVKTDRPCKKTENGPEKSAAEPKAKSNTGNDCISLMDLRSVLEWQVAVQLRGVPGVVEVNSFGGELKTYEVVLQPERLLSLGLGLEDVFRALKKSNRNAGGGYILRAGEQRLIRGEGLITSLDDIRNTVVDTRDGIPIRIADLAQVRFAPMLRQGAATRDGRGEVVTGIVMMLLGENSREVAKNVHERVEELKPSLPPHIAIDTYYDRTELVDRTIATVAVNLLEGAVLVIVVLLLLLGNLRGGLLVASMIPLSMLAAFIAMHMSGLSGNLMSLGALDFGLIVDGAVVVVENIVRRLSMVRTGGELGTVPEARASAASSPQLPAPIHTGLKPELLHRIVSHATVEVAKPVIFAVCIIMIVYIPILSLEGMEGKMFKPMALTVLFALAASLILALVFVPAVAPWVFRKGIAKHETRLMKQIKRFYHPLLRASLERPLKVLAASVLLFIASLGLMPFLGAQFLPRLQEGALAAEAIRLPSVSLESSLEATTRIEKVALAHFPDEISTVVSRTGRPEIATDPMGVQQSDIYFILKPPDAWKRASGQEELAAKLQAVLGQEILGHNFVFLQPIELRTNELISGTKADVAVHLYGESLETLSALGERVASILRKVPGAGEVSHEQVTGMPYLRIRIDRASAGRYGVEVAQILDLVETVGGKQVGQVFEGQKRFALQVRFPEDVRRDVDTLRNLPLTLPSGSSVPLGQLADLSLEPGPMQISREGAQRRLTVQVNVAGADLAGFVSDAKKQLSRELDMPPGYVTQWGGSFKNLESALSRLAIAVPASLILILLLLYTTYGALRPALLIYLNIPMAATGGLIALSLRGMPLSVSAAVGFIALFGIAVMNGVVLVSSIRDLKSSGIPLKNACEQGAMLRIRPVLMTALTDAIGFLPMAISASAGAEVQRPLATVVMGGLATSTLLTLFVLPAVYSRFGIKNANDTKSENGMLPV